MDLIYESMPCQVRPISMRKTEGTGNAHDADLVKDSPMRELVRNWREMDDHEIVNDQ